MANDYFKFKQFTIFQDKCAMKVGTDGVLLGAWVNVENCTHILDVGSGSGLISLMLAQRSLAKIDGLELDPDAAEQAAENFKKSPWAERLNMVRGAFQDYSPEVKTYDLIVSNPPFFVNSFKGSDQNRTMARHNDSLPVSDLVNGVAKILSKTGRFSLVIPSDRFSDLLEVVHASGMFLIRKTEVKPTPTKQPHRILAEFSFTKREVEQNHLVIEEFGRHQYSAEYIDLTKYFYLKM